MPIVQAADWSWRHAGRARRAVDRLTLSIERGERVLVLGASGSGKSTLLEGLAGILDASLGESSGELLIDGSPAERRNYPRALLRQDPETSVVLTRVWDEARFGSENLGASKEESDRRAENALRAVGLDAYLEFSTATLSGGQKQRLSIAALLAMRPKLWLLDEPTSQLDQEGALGVIEAVQEVLDVDDTLVLVEHLSAAWWPILTRVVALDSSGRLVFDGTPEYALGSGRSELDALGVWLPGVAVTPCSNDRTVGAVLCEATDLAVGRAETIATVSLELREGAAFVVRGRNGAGKSTLALTLGGLIRPRGGTLVAQLPWAPLSHGRIHANPWRWSSRQLSARIATVFQQPDLQFVRPTVRQEIALGARSVNEAQSLLERFSLEQYLDQHPRTLSGGEKRRLSVATALASKAQLLIADEPTFGQDRHTWNVVVSELAHAAATGRSLVLTSHDAMLASTLVAHELWIGPDIQAGRHDGVVNE